MKNYTKSIMVAVVTGLTIVCFQNCAQRLSSDSASEGTQKIDLSSFANNQSFAPTSQSTVAVAAANNSNKVLLDMFDGLKISVSNSLSGTFVENGSICRGQNSYVKMTGVNPNIIVKGCASPTSGAAGCLDAVKHRAYLASEWIQGNIVTSITAAESYNYPLGEYSFFVSGSNANTTIIQKVGVATLKTCTGTAAPAAPVAKQCQFVLLNPQAVVGGGVNIYPFVCNEQAAGRRGVVIYSMSPSSSINFDGECRCQ